MRLDWKLVYVGELILTHIYYNEAATRATALGILDLMGFKCSLDKLEFSLQAEMLGVELNRKSFHEGKIIVKNKESRFAEMIDCIDRIFGSGFIESDEIPSALGKMQYPEAQLWGRAGRIALSDLREATLHKDSKIPLTPDVEQALRVLKDKFIRMESLGPWTPRRFGSHTVCSWMVLLNMMI